MPPTHSVPALVAAFTDLQTAAGNEIASASLAFLCELESSLQASQKALLTLDVAGIEQGTQEQIRLAGKLSSLLPEIRPDPAASAERLEMGTLPWALQWEAEMRATANRVLALTRLLALVLCQSQQLLTVLSNLIAGTAASYAPMLLQRAKKAQPFSGRQEQKAIEKDHSCRA
jgi:hypothetical protein